MIKMVSRLVMATAALTIALPATAQNGAIRTAHDAYVAGDYTRAERVLIAEQRIFPNSPEVLVNLAAVYHRTGRVQQAMSLYRQILQCDDVLLDLTVDRTASSHAIATIGMERLGASQTAAR